ncbi:MAG TPA: carboxymuconolactone decarboxylase family protein [Terriglobia bacterium]|nr:carboxymuconolactone decarboxylase family protein [Terriglobia bacterium]
MARLRYVEVETATPDQQKILGQLTQKSGKIANIWKLWSHSPHTLEAFIAFNKSLVKGTLDPKLRELAYMKASLINNCAYCLEAHKAAGRRIGITEQQIQEIGTYAASSAFSPLEKLVLRYAEELTITAKTGADVMAELKEHLSEADIVELNLTVGTANLTNRFNMSMMTDLD